VSPSQDLNYRVPNTKQSTINSRIRWVVACMGEARNSYRIFPGKGRCRFRWENHIKLKIEMRMLGTKGYEWLGNEDRSLHTKFCVCDIFLH